MKNIIAKQQMDMIHQFLNDWEISKYKINSDGSVDVNQNVRVVRLHQDVEIPFKFNIINGDFILNGSNLQTLHNMPDVVNGDFDVAENDLRSLIGCPRIIKGDFFFGHNMVHSTYVGDYDVQVRDNIHCYANDFNTTLLYAISNYEDFDPDMDDIADIEYYHDIIKVIFKYQVHFNIWENDGVTLNEANFQELMDEVKDGLL